MLCWPLAVQAQQVLQAQVSLARPEKNQITFWPNYSPKPYLLGQKSTNKDKTQKSRWPTTRNPGGQPIAQKMNLEELLEEGRGNGKNELVSLDDDRLRMVMIVMMLNLHWIDWFIISSWWTAGDFEIFLINVWFQSVWFWTWSSPSSHWMVRSICSWVWGGVTINYFKGR